MALPMAARCAKTASLPSSFAAAFRSLSLTSKRNFSGTRPSQRTAQLPPEIPPYPYGPRRTFKQADTGLYGGSTIQFGNKISKGKNKGKTRRDWKPNIRRQTFYSEALGRKMQIKVQYRVKRTIEKVGGLDAYLLGDKPARIKELGIFGWRLRWMVMTSEAMKKRFREERKRLHLKNPETFQQFLARYTLRQQVQAAQDDHAAHQAKLKASAGPATPPNLQQQEQQPQKTQDG